MISLTGPQRRWIAALRSGEFQQCRGALHRPEGYCCLGVACELYRRELRRGEWMPDPCSHPKKNFTFAINGEHEDAMLPDAVAERLGLGGGAGSVCGSCCCFFDNVFITSCVAANDQKQYKFGRIADLLEQNPDQFFVQQTPEQLLERLTAADLIAEVRALAAERPNVVYDTADACLYTLGECTDGTCGCLIGQALVSLGFPAEWLRERLDEHADVPGASSLVRETLGLKFTPDELEWLSVAQWHQDSAYEWGKVVAKTDQDLGVKEHEQIVA